LKGNLVVSASILLISESGGSVNLAYFGLSYVVLPNSKVTRDEITLSPYEFLPAQQVTSAGLAFTTGRSK
jgi:hypothetical protein